MGTRAILGHCQHVPWSVRRTLKKEAKKERKKKKRVKKMCGEGRRIGQERSLIENMMNRAKLEAVLDTDESWNKIERTILPGIISYPDHNVLSLGIIDMYKCKDGPVRDLAATITAELKIDTLRKNILDEVKSYTITGIEDEHKYARFRATIATIKHGWNEPEHYIRMGETLCEIINTESGDLVDLANEYLRKISDDKNDRT